MAKVLEPAEPRVIVEPAEQRVIVRDVSWQTYECLMADNEDRSVPRIAYDHGVLELMSPSVEHESLNRNIAYLFAILTEEFGIDMFDAGSTTFKRPDLKQAFEPDSCFYVQNAGRVRGTSKIDLAIDPPPDLIVEIDISRSSLNKLPMYAQLGIPEVWRHDGDKLVILVLEGAGYAPVNQSGVLPTLSAAILGDFIEQSKTLDRLTWVRNVREWARARGGQAGDPRSGLED